MIEAKYFLDFYYILCIFFFAYMYLSLSPPVVAGF